MAFQQPQPMMQQPQNVMQQSVATNVIVNQQQERKTVRDWRSGLCACFDDCGICVCVYFCTCCAAIQISRDMGEDCLLPFCVPNFMIPLRTKLRTQLNIQGSICNDCFVTTCCPQCALGQLMREHKTARNNGEL